MSFTTDLLEGIAENLAANVAGLTWSPTADYAADETGIVLMAVPLTPARLVTLTPYPLDDDAVFSDSTVGLQIRSRSGDADPRDVFEIDDSIADYLLGNFPLTLTNGVRILVLVRSSAVSLGQDASKHWEWSSNYRLDLYRPATHRL